MRGVASERRVQRDILSLLTLPTASSLSHTVLRGTEVLASSSVWGNGDSKR